jgi:uncharacterized membrane protein HdeD (DUF308 family)
VGKNIILNLDVGEMKLSKNESIGSIILGFISILFGSIYLISFKHLIAQYKSLMTFGIIIIILGIIMILFGYHQYRAINKRIEINVPDDLMSEL